MRSSVVGFNLEGATLNPTLVPLKCLRSAFLLLNFFLALNFYLFNFNFRSNGNQNEWKTIESKSTRGYLKFNYTKIELLKINSHRYHRIL